jgi:hypothetical protein
VSAGLIHTASYWFRHDDKVSKAKRITKVTVETERLFIFRNAGTAEADWCSECAAETQVATVAHAAREAGLSEWAIYQLLDGRALHFSEDADGRVLICLNSLGRIVQGRQR